jgi:hypothetical protein
MCAVLASARLPDVDRTPEHRFSGPFTPFLPLQGSLESVLGGTHNPFRPNRSWPAYLARRALLRTALEVAEALTHLHANGLVHGALRPCHVLLLPCSHDRRNFRTKVRLGAELQGGRTGELALALARAQALGCTRAVGGGRWAVGGGRWAVRLAVYM